MQLERMVRPVLPVLTAVVFLELAIGALGPVAGVQLVERGASASIVGVVSSAYYAGFLIGALFGHRVIDRVGHIRAFSALAVLAADAALLHPLIGMPYAWAALRAVIGVAVAGLFVVVESWLNDKSDRETRGRVFATYMVASWAAAGIAPLLLSVANPNNPLLFTAVALAFATAVLPMALTTVGNPEIDRHMSGYCRPIYQPAVEGMKFDNQPRRRGRMLGKGAENVLDRQVHRAKRRVHPHLVIAIEL